MKRSWIVAGILFLSISLAGCAGILNLTVTSDGYTVHENLAYGSLPRQTLDIYIPKKKAAGSPVIVFFYGGRWSGGTREDYLFVGQALASKGFTAVVADYRVYPKVYFPAFVEDSAKAVSWVQGHIGTYGGNPRNVFLAGHSAGAYIALMLVSDTSYLEKTSARLSWIRGTIGIAGPYDFLPFTDKDVIDIFSRAPQPETQPINFVHPGMPPTFLATGTEDTTVKPRNSYNMAKKLKQQRNKVELHSYKDVAHIGIIISLTDLFRSKAPLLNDIANFVKKYGVKDGNGNEIEEPSSSDRE